MYNDRQMQSRRRIVMSDNFLKVAVVWDIKPGKMKRAAARAA